MATYNYAAAFAHCYPGVPYGAWSLEEKFNLLAAQFKLVRVFTDGTEKWEFYLPESALPDIFTTEAKNKIVARCIEMEEYRQRCCDHSFALKEINDHKEAITQAEKRMAQSEESRAESLATIERLRQLLV